MENNMVTNNYAENNCNIVEKFFSTNFSNFSVSYKYMYSPYWHIILEYQYVKIEVDGDIGFTIDISIDNSKYPLWQYDRSIVGKTKTTDENILYQLSVLKRFLDEVGYSE
ncbi:hypothetical protein FACS1894199_16360 [Bacteroidia bacterium]|nr:hypothetical protein FACS1894199_16360 [Bacteroidia bacterium]